jgi:ubiquinol-cytochrome c reductase cytochrome c subunit
MVLLLGALAVIATVVALLQTSTEARAEVATASQTQVEEGRTLYLEGCASCHGLEAQGSSTAPSLIGVGAAAVHFQVATGRMPLAAPAWAFSRLPRKQASWASA